MIQSDADNTIYRGNLLVSLGWLYLFYLFKEKKYYLLIKKLIQLPRYYIIYLITQNIERAYVPFKDCPINLILSSKKRIKKSWLKKVGSSKVVIITRQDKNLLDLFLKGKIKNYRIVGNEAETVNGKITGNIKVNITNKNKLDFIDKNIPYIGDLRDYLRFGKKVKFV